MKIEYNPAVELCCALLQYAHWKELSDVRISGYTVSPELEKWYGRSRQALPGILDNDISYLIGNFLGLLFLPVELAIGEGIDSVPELIEKLRALPSESLPERLYEDYLTGIPFESIQDHPEKIKKAIEKAGGTTRKKEPELFAEFVHSPGSMQSRLVATMEEFYKIAVQPHEEEVRLEMEKQIASDQVILDAEPERFFMDYCRINRSEGDPEPKIFISYYDEVDIIQMENPVSLIYGRRRNNIDCGGLPLDQVYRLLADESRRTILQMLCRKPRFIRELATELGLTSATVSYHVSRLSALDLVTYERGERKRIYYRADLIKVEAMLDAVKKDIVGGA
ncbi:MAG: winged helix-turn-helix transcriptional regulator [Spirochaetales bacterium]|nr:winged helix-turn-helix transcriptional regulator [Spirochaetales bacterium]